MIAMKDPVYFLLVDDLEENLLSLEALLRRDGLALLLARSGPEALELLLKHDVALALLDIQMPGMDGFELAELMRGNGRTKTVPIIFLTAGSADWQRRFRGYEAGAVDFLQKPIEPDILRSKAQVFFDLYRQQQQITRQRDKLQEADHRKDEFLATLAHELRNPLAPIRNGLQVLRMSNNARETEDIRNMMDRQLTHLVRLIDDLLDISRVSQGKIELRREKITFENILESAIEASTPFIEAGKHTFNVDVPSETLWLYADLTRVAQIITNLVNNAAKYTPDGGTIGLSARHDSDDNNIIIAVTDNGLGIPADMLPKVFDLFTQVGRSLDRSQGGLGIGLALVKRLVEMHGGAIQAQSGGPGKGSAFTVRLPLTTAPAVTQKTAAPAEDIGDKGAPPQGSLEVLIVDDNIDSAKTTGWMLEMIGLLPTLAHDGVTALQIAKELHPDVILLDIGLPGMNGYEVCQELRKDPTFKDTLLIAQTGWGRDRDKQKSVEMGFDHHLVKPVSLKDISALLSTVKKAAG